MLAWKSGKSLSLLGVACFVCLHARPVAAENYDYFELPPEQLLNTEVISASKRPEKISETATAVYIITSEDIIRSGVQSIPEALRMAPACRLRKQIQTAGRFPSAASTAT